MPWRGVTVSGPGLDVPRIRVIELKTGYENARSQYLSRCPFRLLLGTDPIRPDLAQIDDRIRDV